MVDEVVVSDLDVGDVGEGQRAEPVLSRNDDGAVRAAGHLAHGAVKVHGEPGKRGRLHQKAQRVHLVAAHGVLGQVGHEDDARGAALRAQQLGGLHAVDAGQLNVEQADVVAAARVQELEGCGYHVDVKRDPSCRLEAPHEGKQRVCRVLLVLHYEQAGHVRLFLPAVGKLGTEAFFPYPSRAKGRENASVPNLPSSEGLFHASQGCGRLSALVGGKPSRVAKSAIRDSFWRAV